MRRLGLLILISAVWALSQEGPHYFELLLPDFTDRAFPGGSTTVDYPPKPIQRMTIQFLNPYADTVPYGNISVTVNGKGLGNVFERRANTKGKVLLMTPQSMGARPDELFDVHENAVEVAATDPRGRRFYQNWVLRAFDGGQNSFFTYSTTSSPDDPQGVPPDLILTAPIKPPVIRVGEKSVRVQVKGSVASKDGGTVVLKNGAPWIPATAGSMASIDQMVAVDRNSSTLVLEAVDKKGNRRSVTIPVIVQQSVKPKARFAGNRYAVVIGISRFGKGKGAPANLEGAAASAGELASQLIASAGFPAQNVRTLLDDQATLDQIKVALGDFAAKATANDLLIIYMATYGLHDPFRPEKLYLTAADSQLSQIDSTGLELGELERIVDSRVRCNHVMLLFDAGHKLDPAYKFPSKNLVNNRLLHLFDGQEGRAVIVSASADEVSSYRDVNGKASSVFTTWTVDGLKGNADINYDGIVTPEELFQYVTEKVRVESSDKQVPQFRLGAIGSVDVASSR